MIDTPTSKRNQSTPDQRSRNLITTVHGYPRRGDYMTGSEDHLLRLRGWLEHSGMSLREFGELAGISHSTLSRILRGKQQASPDTMKRIERALLEQTSGGRPLGDEQQCDTARSPWWLLLIPLSAALLGLVMSRDLRTSSENDAGHSEEK
jgi:transcriptional regulator with XRE-family HTH domain